MHKAVKSVFLVLFILILDQIVKIWIKTHMMLHDEIYISGNWFIIHFTENNGMAFGWGIPGNYGKTILSIFRLLAIIGIIAYIVYLIKQNSHIGLIITMSLILAGALGNIIDCLFYGIIFDHSYGQIATIFPPDGGYSSFLHGRVVDMFYFPIIKGLYPSWIPFLGGDPFIFFSPVFNIADASITTGVIILLIFQKKYFKE